MDSTTDYAYQRSIQKASRQRRQRRIVGFITFVIVMAMIGVIGVTVYRILSSNAGERSITQADAYSALQQIAVKPRHINDKGGIVFSRQGYQKKEPAAPTISLFTDPMCPGCAVLHQQTASMMRSMLDAGQVNLEIYPITFLDHMSTDDYSSRVDNAICYISSYDPNPDHLIDFITRIHSTAFQPSEGPDYKPVTDERIAEQATAAGVPADVVSKAFKREYDPWLQAAAQYTLRRPELMGTSGRFKGKITTPGIVVNNQRLDIDHASEIGLTYQETLLQSIGLDKSSIGQEGQQASIGPNGKPIEAEPIDGRPTELMQS